MKSSSWKILFTVEYFQKPKTKKVNNIIYLKKYYFKTLLDSLNSLRKIVFVKIQFFLSVSKRLYSYLSN